MEVPIMKEKEFEIDFVHKLYDVDFTEMTIHKVISTVNLILVCFEKNIQNFIKKNSKPLEQYMTYSFVDFLSKYLQDKNDRELLKTDPEKVWKDFTKINDSEYISQIIRKFVAFVVRKIIVWLEN